MTTINDFASWMCEDSTMVCFTGAGISTESGIPDFRSPGGVWSRTQPVMFDDFVRSPESRREYWRQKSDSHDDFAAAEPNVAHRVLAGWESTGRLRGVITQNIDGLHQQAGSTEVLELHGTAREIACLDCRYRVDAAPLVEQFRETEAVPECPECGGLLKHATISFGQSLSADVLQSAIDWSRHCSIFLVLGSSLVVHPAASLPALAAENGARLVIVNRDETPLDSMASLVIRDSIGETMRRLDELVSDGEIDNENCQG